MDTKSAYTSIMAQQPASRLREQDERQTRTSKLLPTAPALPRAKDRRTGRLKQTELLPRVRLIKSVRSRPYPKNLPRPLAEIASNRRSLPNLQVHVDPFQCR
jgi:hypothetical protein